MKNCEARSVSLTLAFLASELAGRKSDEDRVVGYTGRVQIVTGERRGQADKAEVDLVAVERQELLGAAHVKEVQRHARAEFAEKRRGSPAAVRNGCSPHSRY